MFGRLISDTKHKSMLKTNKFLNNLTFWWNLTFEILIGICFRCCRIRIQTNEFLYLTIRWFIFNFDVCFHFKSNSWNLFLLSFVCQAAITYEWDENIPSTTQKIYEKEKRREDEEREIRMELDFSSVGVDIWFLPNVRVVVLSNYFIFIYLIKSTSQCLLVIVHLPFLFSLSLTQLNSFYDFDFCLFEMFYQWAC